MNTFPLRSRDVTLLRRQMDRLFDDAFTGGDDAPTVWSPRADVAETEDAYVLSLDLPGIDRGSLDVTLDDGTLKISGERRHTGEHTDGRMHRVERAHGRFFRTFTLGTDLDADAIEAHYDDGVLTVRIGKTAAVQPRRIEVGSRSTQGQGQNGSQGQTEDATVVNENAEN